ncbi:uncharacterized protein SCHCODRAFT_01097040 [Schizophyllum commune H4-8]|uniref:Uncharacterized protein n=1 Tax=Schizophyllum commune (strain H4-8 / FGSC 9210) TaxID=578458 RepID=D8Q6Q0_SCHCM|nr:uncharacterized protein SCHCODRAFT_01097040 [Schizophyllum commune H4-8]KAI5891834.1 hypothetical protein SCHCODRAFT_01097040 [Schizophyllum commune H4-8]
MTDVGEAHKCSRRKCAYGRPSAELPDAWVCNKGLSNKGGCRRSRSREWFRMLGEQSALRGGPEEVERAIVHQEANRATFKPFSTAEPVNGGAQGRDAQAMLAMTRSPRQPSNLHWSTVMDGSVRHTYSKNQIAAALHEARRTEMPCDNPTTSTDDQTREPDAHRPSGSRVRAFGDDMTNAWRPGKEEPRIVLPEIVAVRISGECPVSRKFLKIVNRVGRAHNLIVRDPKTRMKVWAAVVVACHARFDPCTHLAFARFLFAWSNEYARYLKRKIRSERRAQKVLKALPSDEELRQRRTLYFARDDGDAWRPYAMEQAARRAEDERRVLQFVLQCKADTARRKAADAKRREAEAKKQAAEEEEEERRQAEERVRWFVEMMARETAKQQAESAASHDGGVARDAVARTTERPKGSSVEEALVNESAKQKASLTVSHNDCKVVGGGVVKGSGLPTSSAEESLGDGSIPMMRRQAASKTLTLALQRKVFRAPPVPYWSNGELKAYPTREDLQACWAALFDGALGGKK